MEFNYIGGTTKQRRWFLDALKAMRFQHLRVDFSVDVQWADDPEPDVEDEYAYTKFVETPADSGNYKAVITFRSDADDTGIWDEVHGDTHVFYMESVVHEIGHVFFGYQLGHPTNIAQLAAMYVRRGGGRRRGTSADWSPMDKPWGDRIVEANAEFFKDVYMPPQYRVYDQRANWTMHRDSFGDWFNLVEAVICPEDDGGVN